MSYKKFTKDIGLVGLTQLIGALSGIVILPVITKLLGAQNYGVWTQVLVTVGLINPIVVLGLPFTLVRFLAGEKDKAQIQDGVWSVFTIIFVVAIIAALLLISFAGAISQLFGCSKIVIIMLALIIMFECLNDIFFGVFRAFQEIKKCSIFTIFQELVEAGLVILSVFLGYGLLGAIASLLVIRISVFLIMGGLVVKRIGLKVPKFLKIKEYLSFGLPAIIGNASSWIIQSSDKYLVGFFMGTIFVGYYAPAYTLGSCLLFFIAPFLFLLPAVLSKHHDANEMEEVTTYLKYSLKYFLAIAIPSVFGISILAKQLLRVFSTQEISQNSYFVVPFVVLAILLFGVWIIFNQIIVLKKKSKISGTIWFIASLLNFGLNLLLIPRFGILGAALTTLIAYAFTLTATWYYSFKELTFEIDWWFIGKSTIASMVMAVVIFALHPLGLWMLLATIAFGALIYFILIFLLKGFAKNEINFIKELFS